MNRKNFLLTGALMCVGLALYRIFVEEPYFNTLEETGKGVGFGEVALGYFMVWGIMTLLSWWILRGNKQA